MLTRIALAGSLIALGGIAAAAPGPDWAKVLKMAKFPLAEGVQRALKDAGEGVPLRADLAEDADLVFYKVRIAQGGKTRTTFLDARDGRVLRSDVTVKDRSAVARACTLGLLGALDKALAAVPGGRLVEGKLDVKGGKPIAIVEVFGGGKITVVTLDGATGAVLSAAPPKPAKGAGPVAPAVPTPAPAPAKPASPEAPFTDVFRVDPSEWSSTGTNPYFVLEPGHVLVLEGGGVKLTITVLAETKRIEGVETRVVEEREEEDGELKEVSRNFFAISKRTNSVYYFGEEVDVFQGGQVAGHPGAWLHGQNGARFGLMVPGTPLLGSRFYQEVAPGVAMDRAIVVGVNETHDTPAGKFEGCLKAEETTPLEPHSREFKVYAPGIGLIRDAEVVLTKVIRARH